CELAVRLFILFFRFSVLLATLARPLGSTLSPYTTLFRSFRQHLQDKQIYLRQPSPMPDQTLSFLAEHNPTCVHPNQSSSHLHNPDRKSTRLNSSHVKISYAVLCLTKKSFYAARGRYSLSE